MIARRRLPFLTYYLAVWRAAIFPPSSSRQHSLQSRRTVAHLSPQFANLARPSLSRVRCLRRLSKYPYTWIKRKLYSKYNHSEQMSGFLFLRPLSHIHFESKHTHPAASRAQVQRGETSLVFVIVICKNSGNPYETGQETKMMERNFTYVTAVQHTIIVRIALGL